MDVKEIGKTEILKPRSYVACLREGLSFPLTHFMGIVRFVWPTVVVVAIVYTICKVLETSIVAQGPYPMLTTRSWIEIGVLEVVDLIVATLLCGQVVYQQRYLATQGWLPTGRPWKLGRQLLQPTLRSLLCSIVACVLFIGGVLIVGSSLALHRPLWLIGGIVPIVLFLLLVPAMLHYLYSDDSLWISLHTPVFRFIGRTTAILIVAGLVLLLCVFVAVLPYLLISLVDMLVFQLTADGDVVVLPLHFPWLRAFAILVYAFLGFYATLLLSYPLLFHWGSTTAIERENGEEIRMK